MSTTINMNDFINKQQNEHTNARTHEVVSDCKVTKLDADALAKLNKGRRSNTYVLTTNTHVVGERATCTKMVVLDAIANTGMVTKYSVDEFENAYGKLKLNILYQHEISAYVQYINYIYVGTHIDEQGHMHNCGLYGFELLLPNMFKVQFVSLNMFNSEYTRYESHEQLMNHMCTFIDE